ncbi:MAG: hypothetical protein ACRD26_23085 [Vicinamibacterales bacterium]
MRVHSAGHVVHDALIELSPHVVPQKGNHGRKASLEYLGALDPAIAATLARRANEIVAADLPIAMRDTSHEEMVSICRFVPASLPKHKRLRTLRIGQFPALPDGGVHVRNPREIGRVVIQSITTDGATSLVKYRVAGSDPSSSSQVG